MNSGRRAFRTRSQFSKSRMSSMPIRFIAGTSTGCGRSDAVGKAAIFICAVGAGQHFERMDRAHAGGLFDLNRRERAVGRHHAASGVAQPAESLLAPFHRELEELLLNTPHPV